MPGCSMAAFNSNQSARVLSTDLSIGACFVILLSFAYTKCQLIKGNFDWSYLFRFKSNPNCHAMFPGVRVNFDEFDKIITADDA
ncbi:protein of unknown function [Pararobbsia alpina]